jgi:hypothetical protein
VLDLQTTAYLLGCDEACQSAETQRAQLTQVRQCPLCDQVADKDIGGQFTGQWWLMSGKRLQRFVAIPHLLAKSSTKRANTLGICMTHLLPSVLLLLCRVMVPVQL